MTNDVDDCLAWVQRAEFVFSSDLTSISDEDAMIEAFGKHEQIYQEMDQQKERIEAVLKRGSSMLDVIPSSEKSSFNERLDVLFKRWSNLSERASDKESNFDSFVSNQENFYEHLEGFVDWMRSIGFQLSQDIDENDEKSEHKENLLIHREYCKDIKRHEQMYEKLMKNGEKILEGLPNERKMSFHEQLLRLKEGWENLVDVAIDKEEDLVELSGFVEEDCIFSRSNSKRSEHSVVKEEVEGLSKDLDIIENGLKEVRKEIGAVKGKTDEKMKHHLAVCLRSDAEMEKIDEVLVKASRLPKESEERKIMDAKIEDVKKEWNEIAETLHRERSDLEKFIEIERDLDNLSDEFDAIESSVDLTESVSVENLESGLEKMICFVDENLNIQERIMKLPEKYGSEVKLKMLSKVEAIFEKANARKDRIGVEIEKIKDNEKLVAEIDQLSLKVAMLNQPPSGSEDDAASEDIFTALASSIKLCQELIEKALSLKSHVKENLEVDREKYTGNLDEMESVLKREIEKKEKELVDLKTSKELTDSLNQEVTDFSHAERLDDLREKLSSAMTDDEFDVILKDAYELQKNLEKSKGKAFEIRDCFPNQTGNGSETLIDYLHKQEKQLESFMESAKEYRIVAHQANVLDGKLKAIKSDLLSSAEVQDPTEKIRIFALLEKDAKQDIENLKGSVREMEDSVEVGLPVNSNNIQSKMVRFASAAAKNSLLELNAIKISLEQNERCQQIEKNIDRMNFGASLSLENLKGHLEKCLSEVEQYENEISKMEKVTENETQKEFFEEVRENCKNCKEKVLKKMDHVSEGISQKNLHHDDLKDCEKLINEFDENGIKEKTVKELQQKILRTRKAFENNLNIAANENVAQGIAKLSEKEADAVTNRQRNVLKESGRIMENLDNVERNVNDFIQLSDSIKNEYENHWEKNVGEFNSIEEGNAKLQEQRSKEKDIRSKMDSLIYIFNVIKSLVDNNEVEAVSKQLSGYEKDLESLQNANECLEQDLLKCNEGNADMNMCNNEISNNLEKERKQFDFNLKNLKTLEDIDSIFNSFSDAIEAAQYQLNSLCEKDLSLPSKEKKNIKLKLEDTGVKLSSANDCLEGWKKKVNDWTDALKEGNNSIENVKKWMDKLEQVLDHEVTRNVKKESEDLGEIEREIEGIGNEVTQICKKTFGTSKLQKVLVNQISLSYICRYDD